MVLVHTLAWHMKDDTEGEVEHRLHGRKVLGWNPREGSQPPLVWSHMSRCNTTFIVDSDWPQIMRRILLILPVLSATCLAQVAAIAPGPGEEMRQTFYTTGQTREMFVVRRYLIVDTLLTQQVDPPYQVEMVIDSAEREFKVAEYLEFFPNGNLKVRGQYGYEYGGDYKDGVWVHYSENGDTLLLERHTRALSSDTLERLDIRLHR